MMNTIVAKIFLKEKILGLIKTLIYKTEIVDKAKNGVEKFNEVCNGFWDKLEEVIEKEKTIDRPFIPNYIEEIGEDVLSEVLKELRKTIDIKEIIQEIFDIEKKANDNIL